VLIRIDGRNLFTFATVSVERMLLTSLSTMNRKSLALAIVLLIAGLAPATAIIGFCSRMPCCSHASDTTESLSTERNDCCTTIACYDTPSLKLTTAQTSADALLTAAALITVAPAPSPAPLIAQAFADTSPPVPVRHRLAILSTLLI
jgi:hypothetical protein